MFLLLRFISSFANDNDLRLWYDKPAWDTPLKSSSNEYSNDIWMQNSLPIGNGFIGASIFGELLVEKITFNEKTLWIGGPSKKRPNYNGGNNIEKGKYGKTMKDIQKLFEENKDDEASNKCDELTGDSDGYGSYQVFGELGIDSVLDKKLVHDYARYLDLDKAIATVQYNHNGTIYKREHLISFPENVMATQITKDGDAKINTDIYFVPAHYPYNMTISNNIIELSGELSDNDLKFMLQILVETRGGSVTENNGKIHIVDADEVTFYVAAKTDYKLEYPHYRTGETMEDLHTIVRNRLLKAKEMGFENVKKSHLSDYQSYFNRVKLNLSHVPSKKTTDDLLRQYKSGSNTPEENRQLELLLFQYGRYLTIESTRAGNDLPANLQGIWNDVNDVIWSSDYHLNINLQMNYFPTYNTDLHECAVPLLAYVEGLRKPGRVTASIYAGINSTEENPENGFMAHTQTTPFGWTCPGWQFSWGWSPAAVPWILHNCYEYYEYTQDIDMLRKKIYPMMREQAVFYEQMIKYEKPGSKLYISSPTYSPEQGPRTNGNIYEQQLIWQHFTNCINAAKALGVDKEKIQKWEQIIIQLKPPVQIGESGQIKEWFSETWLGSIGSHGHRHLSHLLGLYPLNLISIDTPEWIEASIISLNDRTDYSTGWGMGQRINAWARTGDGNHAHTLLHNLLCDGIYNNLWDTHPPFQIDGNFAATAGVTEMLLQSNLKAIHILPALPDAWKTGYVEGLIARGNFKFNITWEDMLLKKVSVLARSGGKCKIYYPNLARSTLKTKEGKNIQFTIIDENTIEFDSNKGSVYVITNVPDIKKATVPSKINCFRFDYNKVAIHWKAVNSATQYFVYKQNGNELPVLVGSTNETTFIDVNTDSNTMYYVTTEQDAVKSSPASIVDVRNLGVIDNSDPVIVYSPRFQKIFDDNALKNALHVLENPKYGERAEVHFVGSSFSIVTRSAKNLRALVNDDKVEIKINARSQNDTIHVYTFDDEGYHVVKIETWEEDGKDVIIDSFIIGHQKVPVSQTIKPSTEPQSDKSVLGTKEAVGITVSVFVFVDIVIVLAYVLYRRKKNVSRDILASIQYESVQ